MLKESEARKAARESGEQVEIDLGPARDCINENLDKVREVLAVNELTDDEGGSYMPSMALGYGAILGVLVSARSTLAKVNDLADSMEEEEKNE